MVVEAVQAYVRLVDGLTRASREKARATAHDLFAQVGLEDVANGAEQRVGKLTEEILSASRANRELLEKLVASEVTKAVSRLGFVRSDDLDELREEIAELQAQLDRQQAGPAEAVTETPAKKTAAAKGTAKRTAAKKTAGATTAATRVPTAPGAAQRLAAERTSSAAGKPATPRTARARRSPAASVPDPTTDAGA
jgi:hypothetical protein